MHINAGLARSPSLKSMHMYSRLVISCGAFLVMATAAVAEKSPVAVGREILVKNCARCHAIDMTGNSPLAKAPPFRDVMKRYDASNLEEALAEGIVTGHNEMPEFTFETDQITAITAYLSSLKK